MMYISRKLLKNASESASKKISQKIAKIHEKSNFQIGISDKRRGIFLNFLRLNH
jgi:hypothetical protein